MSEAERKRRKEEFEALAKVAEDFINNLNEVHQNENLDI